MSNRVREILDYCMPFMITGGDYARQIQKSVALQPVKDGPENPFFQALTDADLSVQNVIEVALLARFPEISFFGEEYQSSLNMKYFLGTDNLQIFLDPIDGTRYYKDGLDDFGVILTVADDSTILGAAIYMPADKRLYFADRYSPARTIDRSEFLAGDAAQELQLSREPELYATYHCGEYNQKLSTAFEVIDVEVAYTPEVGCAPILGLMSGKTSGVAGCDNSIIDWGSIAFIAAQAGGVVSDFSGNPLPAIATLTDYRYPELLVSATPAMHEQALAALQGR